MSEKQSPFENIKAIFSKNETVPNKEEFDSAIQGIRDLYEKYYKTDYSDCYESLQEGYLHLSDTPESSKSFLIKQLGISPNENRNSYTTELPYLRAIIGKEKSGLFNKRHTLTLTLDIPEYPPQDTEKHDYNICGQIITIDNQKIYESLDRSVKSYENEIIELAKRYGTNYGVMEGSSVIFGSMTREINIYPIKYIQNELKKRFEVQKIGESENGVTEYQTNVPYLHFFNIYGSLKALVSKDFGKDVSSENRDIEINIDPEQSKITKEIRTDFKNGMIRLGNKLKFEYDESKKKI